MVVVLCDNYYDAECAFRAWVAFLQLPPADQIAGVDKYSLRVETSDGLVYIFVDYRFKNVFEKKLGIRFEPIGDFLDYYWVEDPDPLRRAYRERISDELA